jgi:hypothetical protein
MALRVTAPSTLRATSPLPWSTQNTTATVTATSTANSALTASTSVFIIAPGTVAATANPQVALYTISVPDGLSAFIQFSTDTS